MKFPATLLRLGTAALPVFLATFATAQKGDKPGHEMDPPPAHWKIPPAPVVGPNKAAATMKVEEGFALDLVASEPMLKDPVALAFDGNGRIWVAEMTGYMPDIDGKLENSTYGRISVLEDTDDDGKIDKHTVFLEKYLLPRAVALVDADKTLLFADNEKLHEVEILIGKDGSIRAGEVKVVDEEFAKGGNPEHKPNGLLRALDNWTYNAKSDLRYKKVDGKWVKEKTETRGQWGISQDDYGRLFTNTNSNLVSVEDLPPGVRSRNPHYTFRTNTTATMKDQTLWPSRINPGVNRGYQDGLLDEDGYLRKPTAASGLVVYRGDQFPERFYGNIFINEPAGNLVKRAVLTEGANGFRTVKSATRGFEFLTSTDERSRIVNSYTAPDGSLYLVDLYRGILQHKEYMTSYLRAQVEERHLDQHIGLGRIWRVRHTEGKPLAKAPRMQEESSAELVAHLSHPNGWWRDTAQRLIVERGGEEAVPGLQTLVAEGTNELSAIHAIWTLEGLGKLDLETLKAGLFSPRPRVAAETVRAAECLAGTDMAVAVQGQVAELIDQSLREDSDVHLRRQLASSVGLIGGPVIESKSDPLLVDLAIGGRPGGELGLYAMEPSLRPLLIEPLVRRNDKEELADLVDIFDSPDDFRHFARAVVTQRRADTAQKLVSIVGWGQKSPEIRKAIVEGLLEGGKDKKFKPMPVKALDLLDLAAKDGHIDEATRKKVAALFKVGTGEEEVFLLTDAHREQYKLGEAQYQKICLACHQIHGNGQQFLAPPLAGSEWILESEQRLIAIVLDGVTGPIEVLGKTYTVPEIQPMMPGLRMNPEFTDEQLAAIMTYVRNTWGNGAPPVSTEAVTRYRESVAPRGPYTPEELMKVK